MNNSIESQYKIKPCPFCGYNAELYHIGSGYVIRCSNRACRAEQIVYPSEEVAVDWWNRRVSLGKEVDHD